MPRFPGPWALLALSGLLASVGLTRSWGADGGPRPVSFVADVRPILARNCYACHGPDEGRRKGKLRLDDKGDAFAEHESGRPFVPGSVASSEALRRIVSDDLDERMPPAKSDRRLSVEQVDVLRRWVEQGAKWESHWAFEPPVKAPDPAVDDPSWPKNPIDRFVLARLGREGLTPSPEADRYTLIRRVSLDLTGLPPTPEAVARFVDDPSPEAYDHLVDRLLRSPAFGERWARMWLDLARYADTFGYEKDLRRSIWRYRDWVIDAFNADMPYDRFTLEQLAGDLLPGSKPDQLLATAFHRNTLVNDEGGTDDEEFRIAAVKDRVDTTAQVWMGLTIGCAKCHSHKYDPITQKEYYQFLAFFDQTEDSDKGDDRPTEPFPDRTHRLRLDAIEARVKALESDMIEPTPDRLAAMERWASALRARRGWTVLRPGSMEVASKSALKLLPDGSVLAEGAAPAKETYTLTLSAAGLTRLGSIRLEAIPDPSMPKAGVGRSVGDGNFVLSGVSVSVRAKGGAGQAVTFAGAEADFSQDGFPVAHALKNPDPKAHGWAVSPQQAKPHRAGFHLGEAIAVADGDELVVTLDHQFQADSPGFSLGRFRLSASPDPGEDLADGPPAAVAAAVAVDPAKRTEAQRRELLGHFANQSPETKPARDEIARLKAEAESILKSVRTPVLRELAAERRRVTRVHNRGNFLDPGETVEPATPATFPAFPNDAPRDRLGLAKWLTAPENPLTARVAANRAWAQFFGRGLVETQEDFGTQGQPPSHPEVLDWLAVDFRDGGWSWKRLCKTIVTSATYRQSSAATPDRLARDRDNRLLARGPRFRLEAEMIRDEALEVSGLLSHKMYGPSVMPYQPDGIWKSTYSSDRWTTSPGDDKHRRGLYTFLKRTSPYPAMLVFDGPSREFCTIRRLNTNTPLQALVTLNDTVYVEAAQALARRAVREGGPGVPDRIGRAVRLALARPPRPREVESLAALYERRRAFYRDHPGEASTFAAEPLGPLPNGWDAADLAALTSVCNVILNLDEFLTRG
jgi:mono/diheme cytochrome c family protein